MKKLIISIIAMAFLLVACSINEDNIIKEIIIDIPPSVENNNIMTVTNETYPISIDTTNILNNNMKNQKYTNNISGKWLKTNYDDYIEFTSDGKLFKSGEYIANYTLLNDNYMKVKYIKDLEINRGKIVSYKLENDYLQWDRIFTNKKYIKKDCIKIDKTINYSDYESLSSEEQNYWFIRKSNNQPSQLDSNLKALLDEYNCLYIGDTDSKQVYITMDMGYENNNTSYVLDLYKERNIKILFFLTGDYIDRNEELVQRIIDEGHMIGNHTNHHPNLASLSLEKVYEEINIVNKKLYDNYGIVCNYVRFPGGVFSEQVLALVNDMGLTPVFWSNAFDDWSRTDNRPIEYFYANITNSMHNGALMLIHNVIKNESLALGDVLDYIDDNGYNIGNYNNLFNK